MTKIKDIFKQLDIFVKKYYRNQLLKGGLLLVSVFIFSLCLFSTLEYFGKFNTSVRLLLLLSFIFLNGFIILTFCIIPLLKLMKLRKGISSIDASRIIGSFFPEIADKLTNILQLNKHLDQANDSNYALLEASIIQKINQINVFSFTNAIDYSQTRKYLKIFLPVLFFFFFLIIYTPTLFTQGSLRIINFSEDFKEKAPFSFHLKTNDLIINEGEDVKVVVELKGTEFPNNIYINSENGSFLMDKKATNSFESTIKKPKNGSVFYFTSEKYDSEKYTIRVLGKSILGKLDVDIVYPKYIGINKKTITNATDITVPEGCLLSWNGLTKNTNQIDVKLDTSIFHFDSRGFSFHKKMKKSAQLSFVLTNKHTNKKDSVIYNVNIIKDEYPLITVNEKSDSVNNSIKYFKGSVMDDYGLKTLNFHYQIKSSKGLSKKQVLNVRKVRGTKNSFDFSVDFSREEIKLKDEVNYFFTISDNDEVNGSKTTRSSTFYYVLPDLNEVNNVRDKEQENTRDELENIVNQTKQFQKDLEQLNKKIKNNNNQKWDNLNELNSLKEKQSDLLNKLQEVQKKLNESTNKKNKLSEIDKELLEKQNQIEELLNEVMDEELKKLLEELEKLLKANDKEEINKNMEDLKESSEDMKNQLDRSLEMLKKLQLNEKIDDVENELKKLADKQKELADKKEKNIEEQKEINTDFEKIKEKIKELQELNKELQNPMKINETKKEEESINNDLNDAEEQIEKNKQKKSSESQNNASQKMDELAEKMNSMQNSSNQQQQEEDMESLRNILESLVILSLEQESLMDKFIKVRTNDPAFRKYGRIQRRINDDTKIVKDSLMSLAKRQPVLATFIDKELNSISYGQNKALEAVGDRKQKKVSMNQQIVMTSYNNLALLLNEVLQQMQSQMQSQMEGGGACNKPGGKGRPKAGPKMNSGDMKEMLKNQLEQLKKGVKDGGKNPGGNTPKKGEKGQGQMGSEGLAKMAAEQSAIRQRLEQLRNELNKKGQGQGNQLNPLIEELKEQQKNIINRNINKETINRQHEILTRLLESEKAILERGFEEKRESKSGKNEEKGNKIIFEEYNKQKLKQIELLRYAEPLFKKYYKEKADEYFDYN